MITLRTARVAIATGIIATSMSVAAPADAHTAGIHDNCTNLNKKWPHGVGLRSAIDKTSDVRVTNFYRNNSAFRAADRHNETLDRDNDKIACEKR